MLHGKKAAQDSALAAKEAFSGKSSGSNLPSIEVKLEDYNNKINIIDLVVLSKLENSKSEVRRLIKGNAIKIDDKIITNEKLIIDKFFNNKSHLKLSVGKKRHLKIELN
jgi:tyrosyl-tRNA synthetase